MEEDEGNAIAKYDVFFESGRPKHELSYCAFLDVLGFSARMKASYVSGTANDLLREFQGVFNEVTGELRKEEREFSHFFYKAFSDNVLLAVPRYSDDMESEFGSILIAASRYQYEMALKGFFVRGGLSVGPLFIDANIVYGAALLSAYRLESTVAVNPITVLCDDTAVLVRRHLRYYSGEWAPQNRAILVNSDGRYFINYLDEAVLESFDGFELDKESLRLHKSRIESSLVEHAHNDLVLNKFLWLAAYHNYFCDMVSNIDGYDDDLKLTGQQADIRISRLSESS